MNTITDRYYRTYSVKKWTFEHLFCIFTYFVIFVVPFYFSFGSKNFWFDEQYSLFNIQFQYTGYYAVQVNSILSGSKQFAIVPMSSISTLTGVSLSVQESADSSNFTLIFTKDNTSDLILSVNLLFFYDVAVPSLSRTVSCAFPVTLYGDIMTSTVTGKLLLQPSSPFNGVTEIKGQYVNIPAYLNTNLQTPSEYSQLVDSYLQNQYKIGTNVNVQSLSAVGTSVTVNVKLLKQTSAVLAYYPSILETFKLKFSTYFGMLILSYLIFRNAMVLLIKGQALECNQRDQVFNNINRNN